MAATTKAKLSLIPYAGELNSKLLILIIKAKFSVIYDSFTKL